MPLIYQQKEEDTTRKVLKAISHLSPKVQCFVMANYARRHKYAIYTPSFIQWTCQTSDVLISLTEDEMEQGIRGLSHGLQ